MMKKEQVLEALKNGNYEIKMEHECGCAIDWVIKHGELQPDISSDCCWVGKVLYVKNPETGITEPIFENVAYEPMGMINAEITKREFEDMLEENELLYILDKMSFDEDKETNYKHEDNLKESLLNYIEENEYTCYIRYPRNFANEYYCILVSKNAEKEDIPEDAEEIMAEEFAERYLKKDTATTKYCIGFFKMTNYKEKIKQCLDNGKIIHDGTNVKFNDGHIIGGVITDTQEELINIIEGCLYREDFSIPQCLR